ncbi:hypothetical protein PoB_007461200 [Plakobranchus ocellatus]|uniref:Uncharacterized protein n=1 Tax=Plakobranchus ocellatus TaxID=259542 RepID=A0AAV4DUX3_9GAST|nr:hypothetical protein PoB_007461200 [Plakobranchus ocellatus]
MKGSDGSSGRAVGYQVKGPRFESQPGPSQFFIAPSPSTKWVARSLTTRRKQAVQQLQELNWVRDVGLTHWSHPVQTIVPPRERPSNLCHNVSIKSLHGSALCSDTVRSSLRARVLRLKDIITRYFFTQESFTEIMK